MRARLIATLGGLTALLLVAGSAAAQTGTTPTKTLGTPTFRAPSRSPTATQGNRPIGTPGFVPSGQSPTGPNGFLPGGTRSQGSQNITLGPGAIFGGYPYYRSYYPPFYPSGYGYGTYPYGNYSDPYNNNYYYPGYYYQPAPVFMPTDALFGPASIQRQMQLNSPPRRASYRSRHPLPVRVTGELAVASRSAAVPVAGKSRGDARQFVQYGDDYFRKGQYAEALQRYRKAGSIDPTLAPALFRQGHAFVALGTYDRASDVYQSGLELEPNWAQSARELDDLYGSSAARPEHREALESAAEDQPRDADLLFVLGVRHYFDHEDDRAIETLQRAAELGAANQVAIDTFLQGIPRTEADDDGVEVGNGKAGDAEDPEAAGAAPPPKPAGED